MICRECKMEIPTGAHKCAHCRTSQPSLRNRVISVLALIGAVIVTYYAFKWGILG